MAASQPASVIRLARRRFAVGGPRRRRPALPSRKPSEILSILPESGVFGVVEYYGYRYYHPELGRWLSRDPIGEDGGLNLYGFIENCPTVKIDYFGLQAQTEGDKSEDKDDNGCCGVWVCTFGCFISAKDSKGAPIDKLNNFRVEGHGKDRKLAIARELAYRDGVNDCAEAILNIVKTNLKNIGVVLSPPPTYDKEPICRCVESPFEDKSLPEARVQEKPQSPPGPRMPPVPKFDPPKLDDPFKPKVEPPKKIEFPPAKPYIET